MTEVLLALVGATIGWLLGLVTNVAVEEWRDRREMRRLRKRWSLW